MKKLFLTAVVALCTLVASAQFMVVTTYDDTQTETMDQWTANMGLGFMVNDALTIGMSQVPAATATADDSYDMWLRYNLSMMDGAYATLQMPTENGSDNMEVGIGFAFNIWNGLYIEPNYMMSTSETDGNRESSFNFGLSYRF